MIRKGAEVWRRLRSAGCAGILILWVPSAAWGAAEALTLETAVNRALAANAELAAARWVVDEARGRAGQAGRWENPELESEVAPQLGGRELRFSIGFSQRFPVTARLRAERFVGRPRVAVAEAEVREAEQRLGAEVREAGVRLLISEAREAVRMQHLGNGRALAAILRRAVGAGEGGSLEVDQMELEIARVEADRLRAQVDRAEIEARFRRLLGLAPGTPLVWSETLSDPDPEAGPLPELDLGGQPSVEAARLRALAASASVDVARARRWDDVRAGVFGEVDRSEDAPLGLETDSRIGVRVSIPLPIWDRGRGRVDEAAAAARRAEHELVAVEQALGAEAAVVVEKMQAARRWIDALNTGLLPRARQMETQLAEAHRQGQRPLADVLRARERQLELEASLVEARGEFHLARSRWLALAASKSGPDQSHPTNP